MKTSDKEMKTTEQLAKHLREVYFGGNWTWSNLSAQLKDLNWEIAVKEVYRLNSIATLVFHIDYYVGGITQYLQGQPLTIKDKYSFDSPDIGSREEWEALIKGAAERAEALASEIEKLDDEMLAETFFEEKYGNYFRNFVGLLEHTHYHLGQIALLRKILEAGKETP